jgi:DNA-binding response OmpR family regulator
VDGVTRVLVAEDDDDIAELMVFKLESAGYAVTAVRDGQAAIDHALAERPDLVLLDWMMPRVSGLQVCEVLRRTPATARVPVILVTARAQETDVRAGLGSGADDYIVKPFSPRELLSRVQAVLAARPQ